MVRHEGPGVTGGFRLSENLTEPAEKILPVRVIPVNTAALNPTADNMLQRSGGINAGSARHAGILAEPNQRLKIDRPHSLTRLWRAEIQKYLTAAIQNMVVLVRYLKEPLRAVAEALSSRADKANAPHVDCRRMPGPNAIASLIRHIVGRSCASFSQENAAHQLA
jgi:hypothetical protein